MGQNRKTYSEAFKKQVAIVLFYELFRSCFFEINRAVSGVFCPALEGEKKSLPGVNPAGKKKREGDPQGIRSADFGRSSGICA